MDFLHVEMPPVRTLSGVALGLQVNSLLPGIVILYLTDCKRRYLGLTSVFHKTLLPLPTPLSHLCELFAQSQMLMILVISFDSKQFISHLFQVALNLLFGVSFSQCYCAHHICPAFQICFAVKGKLVYRSSHRLKYSPAWSSCLAF